MKTHFIDSTEYEQFNSKDTYVERHVISKTDVSPEKKELNSIIKDEFKKFLSFGLSHSGGQFNIKFMCIDVEKDDGMTWAAEGVRRLISDSFPRFDKTTFCLQGGVQSTIPEISKIIKEKRFLATISRFIKIKNNKKKRILIILIGLSITLVTNIIGNIIASPEFKINNILNTFNNSSFWIIFIVILLLSAIAYFIFPISDSNSTEEGNPVLNKFDDVIEQKNEIFLSIRDNIIEKLRPKQFRIIIVDSYSSLDYFTKQVIKQYLLNYKPIGASEFWIIFETDKNTGYDSFKNLILTGPGNRIFQDNTRLYKMMNISYEQKTKLINILNIDEDARHYSLIKSVCKANIINSNWNIEQLVNYRELYPRDPEIYQDFELFYVLAIASAPIRMKMEKESFLTIFRKNMEEGKLKRIVLEKLLHNTKHSSKDLRTRLGQFFVDSATKNRKNELLVNFVEIDSSIKTPKYSIKPEIKYSLVNNYRILHLPKPELCHLFWSFYWGDNIHKRNESSWLRQLSHHLQYKGEYSIFEKDVIQKIDDRLFNIYIQTIDGCFQTGLFEEIIVLLKDLIELSEEETFENRTIQLNKVILRVWKAFLVLRDPDIIADLMNLYDTHSLLDFLIDDINLHTDYSEELFWDMIPSKELRNLPLNMFSVFTKFPIGKESDVTQIHSISTYAKINTEWIQNILRLLALEKFFSVIDQQEVVKYIYYDYNLNKFDNLIGLLSQSIANLQNKESSMEINLMTISDLIWNLGLTQHLNCTYLHRNLEINSVIKENENLDKLLLNINQFANDMELVFNHITKNGTIYEDNYYFVKSITFDIFANCIMAIVISIESIQTINSYSNYPFHQTVLEELNKFIRTLNHTLNYNIPTIATLESIKKSSSLFDKLNSLNKLCIITWQEIDLNNLANILKLKEIQFNILNNNYTSYASAAKAASELIGHSDYFGIISNLLLTLAEKESIELQSYAYISAFKLLCDNDYGDKLSSEMFLLFFECYKNHSEVVNVDKLLKRHIDSGFFTKYLNNVSDENLEHIVFQYFNLINSDNNFLSNNDVDNILINRISLVNDEEAKSILMSQLESRLIIGQINNTPKIDIENILNNWNYDRTSHVFAKILLSCIYQGHTDIVFEEALRVLKYNIDNFTYLIFVFLSSWFCKKGKSKLSFEDEIQIIKYLDSAIENWAPLLRAEENIYILTILAECSLPQSRGH